MGMAREWNLSWRLRLVIACCAVGYLLFARPWSGLNQSIAIGAYTCSAAFLTLALVPRQTRLWVAVCAALAVPVLAEVIINLVHLLR
ncbi:hypothetical protein SAMN05216570_0122 [Dyella sp. OK004]|nr:hypothetical protein SAMN05216570_0122 [Dyella sp. OK004]